MPRPLLARVEEAGLNGWPCVKHVLLDGWLLRLADGHTRRSNSVTVIRPDTGDFDDRIAACERIYGAHGQPAIFRIVHGAMPELERALDTSGYLPAEDETVYLYTALRPPRPVADSSIVLASGPDTAWLDALARFQEHSALERRTQQAMMEALPGPALFASARGTNGEIAAVAFGAVHDGLVCVNAVLTDPRLRRQGLSQRLLAQIHHWAQHEAGAEGSCLAVVADNTPAIALYRRIGFATEVGRYHYRRQR